MKFNWSSFKKVSVPKTIGSVLVVDLPLLGIDEVTAKVDTGAYSGALHATNIREMKSDEGKTSLRFSPLGSNDHTIEIDSYHKRRVKSSNGATAVRYAIDTEVAIEGRVYPITFTLTDRHSMRYHMLIGRNFLRVHGFLVDVTQRNK